MITDLRIVDENWAAELPSEADMDSLLNPSYMAELISDEDEGSDTSEYTTDNDNEEFNIDEYTSDEESEDEIIERQSRRELSRNSYMEDRSHRMLEQLRIDMYYVSTSDEESMSDQEFCNKDESAVVSAKLKKKTKRKNRRAVRKNNICDDENDVNIDDIDWLSKRQRKKRQRKAALFGVNGKTEKKSVKERRLQRKMERDIRNRDRPLDFSKIPDTDLHSWGHFCDLCSAEFATKNRLVAHLKKSGHNSYIPDRAKSKKNSCDRTSRTKKNFYRRNH